MTAVVFIGPTLAVNTASQICGATYLPPAAQGDIYRAVRQYNPHVLAIVDGYFRQLPAVWHKEILWAMKQGIHVLGSSSMGALRAAELADFGMEGVGEIFNAYQRGTFPPFTDSFEDDDEVAITHGPEETGYSAVSTAMVNIRATLGLAANNDIVTRESCNTLASVAKSIFYPQRDYPNLLQQAGERKTIPAQELDQLSAWLPDNKIDQKRIDAETLLRRINSLLMENETKQVDYEFRHTSLWESFVCECEEKPESPSSSVTDQLRLAPGLYSDTRKAAFIRCLMLEKAKMQQLEASSEECRRYLNVFRSLHGLDTQKSLQFWLDANHLEQVGLDKLIREECLMLKLQSDSGLHLESEMLAELRRSGKYPQLSEQANFRQTISADQPPPESSSPKALQLQNWYFDKYLGEPMPSNIASHAVECGFQSPEAFMKAVWGLYLDLNGNNPEDTKDSKGLLSAEDSNLTGTHASESRP